MRGENWINQAKKKQKKIKTKEHTLVPAGSCGLGAVPLKKNKEEEQQEGSTGAEREGASAGSVGGDCPGCRRRSEEQGDARGSALSDVAPGAARCRAVSPGKQRLTLANATWDCRPAGYLRCGTVRLGLANHRGQTALPPLSLVPP